MRHKWKNITKESYLYRYRCPVCNEYDFIDLDKDDTLAIMYEVERVIHRDDCKVTIKPKVTTKPKVLNRFELMIIE